MKIMSDNIFSDNQVCIKYILVLNIRCHVGHRRVIKSNSFQTMKKHRLHSSKSNYSNNFLLNLDLHEKGVLIACKNPLG